MPMQTSQNAEFERNKSFNAVLGHTKTQVLQSKHYLHAFKCRNIPSAVYAASRKNLSLSKHAFCALR